MLPHSIFMVFVCIQFSLSLYLILKRRSQNSEGIGRMLPPFKGEHFGLDNSTCTYHKSMVVYVNLQLCSRWSISHSHPPHETNVVFLSFFLFSYYITNKRKLDNEQHEQWVVHLLKLVINHNQLVHGHDLGIVDDIAHPLMIFLIALMLLDEQLVMNP